MSLRIIDPELKYCHQCRQKKVIEAYCNNDTKKCSNKFCRSCLTGRYAERPEEMPENWSCPECRGFCNCSACMRKKGFLPTGILTKKVKQLGFASASHYLQAGAPELLPQKPEREGSKIDIRFLQERALREIKVVARNVGSTSEFNGTYRFLLENENDNQNSVSDQEEIINLLPEGVTLTSIADINLNPEIIGPSLQFLEFCKTFGKVFGIKDGEPLLLLREVTSESVDVLSSGCTPILNFQFNLLSTIQKDSGAKSPVNSTRDGDMFLQALEKCISGSGCKLEGLPVDCFVGDDVNNDAYYKLDSLTKLRILNFLCDEVLNTKDMRGRIDEQNKDFTERQKKAKQIAKENQMKQIVLYDEAILTNGSVSVSPCEEIPSSRKEGMEKTAEMLEAEVTEPPQNEEEEEESVVLRTKTVCFDRKGNLFWKLRGYPPESYAYLVQEIKLTESGSPEENWYTYGPEKRKAVEDYISIENKNKRRRRGTLLRKSLAEPVSGKPSTGTNAAIMELGTSNGQLTLTYGTEGEELVGNNQEEETQLQPSNPPS